MNNARSKNPGSLHTELQAAAKESKAEMVETTPLIVVPNPITNKDEVCKKAEELSKEYEVKIDKCGSVLCFLNPYCNQAYTRTEYVYYLGD